MLGERWVEVTPSQFPHEAEGLNLVRAALPSVAPLRAWSNFEFRDSHGKWHEVDLLVLGRRRLHLVELKHFSGVLRGNDLTWRRDGRRAIDSPLLLARRKAQRLKSCLEAGFTQWARERGVSGKDAVDHIPFIQESVFLHHEHFRCELPLASRMGLFGLDGRSNTSGLSGISERLLESARPGQAITTAQETAVFGIMQKLGLVARRQREAGSWVIDEAPLAEGEGWQDWPAFHRVASEDRARIRFFVTTPGAPAQEAARQRTVAAHEYRIMSRLAHEALIRPKDLVESDLGVGLVYGADDRFQRLDLWLADQPDGIPVEHQIAIVRQVAEAVGYAHGNSVVHRGLTPRAIYVRPVPGAAPRVRVGDWQSSGRSMSGGTGTSTGVSVPGVTGLIGTEASGSASAARLAAVIQARGAQADRRADEAFQAPEGVWTQDVDRVRLDVFALGALAYYLVSGRPPAHDRTGLRERLRRDTGLDLSADLPQVPSALRALVLNATRSVPSERLSDVGAFLDRLSEAERRLDTTTEVDVDPLEAVPGAVIASRFEVVRRLGAGSTAVGLLVIDRAVEGAGLDARRVLKVALDDAAAARLTGEAQVLSSLEHPRLVRMIGDAPLELPFDRRALLLEHAGDRTLADALRERRRLSLDRLERWGSDLLEALVALDRAGVDHRDIKPANLGVRENRGDRVQHLVLYDFSLSRAAATAVSAGTPPYLDPFLGTGTRDRFDSAAERYSAGVVLFEMATGGTPVYREPGLDPASVPDQAHVVASMFDPSLAVRLVPFFERSLAREASRRFDTAADMLTAWQAAFAPLITADGDPGARVTAATATTLLVDSGLSARALSALEPLGVHTVGDLLALDSRRLHALRGVNVATRKEVTDRASAWRTGLAASDPADDSSGTPGGSEPTAVLPHVRVAVHRLLDAAGSTRAEARRALARLVLGVDGGVDAFANLRELAAATGVTRARANQQLADLYKAWTSDPAAREVLETCAVVARESLDGLGGVATVDELADALLAACAPAVAPAAAPGVVADRAAPRAVAGLLRLALDLPATAAPETPAPATLNSRRRAGRVKVLAQEPEFLDLADALGGTVQDLVTATTGTSEPLVSATRATSALRDIVVRVAGDKAAHRPALNDGGRLLRLGVALSMDGALSGSDELHHRDLHPLVAVPLALAGIGANVAVTPRELRERVRARFPALAPLPERDQLDQLLALAGLDLVYDAKAQAYRAREQLKETTGLASRAPTITEASLAAPVEHGHIGRRLAESTRSRSFLALAVELSGQPKRADDIVQALRLRYGATVLDLTGALIDALRDQAAEAGVPWDAVQAADAAHPGTRQAQGLAALVQRAFPAVETAIETALASATGPVLLTEAAALARYQGLGVLSRWSDLTTRRDHALWLLVPQLMGNHGPVLDGRPLPLGAPGQFLRLDHEWLAAEVTVPSAT